MREFWPFRGISIVEDAESEKSGEFQGFATGKYDLSRWRIFFKSSNSKMSLFQATKRPERDEFDSSEPEEDSDSDFEDPDDIEVGFDQKRTGGGESFIKYFIFIYRCPEGAKT